MLRKMMLFILLFNFTFDDIIAETDELFFLKKRNAVILMHTMMHNIMQIMVTKTMIFFAGRHLHRQTAKL